MVRKDNAGKPVIVIIFALSLFLASSNHTSALEDFPSSSDRTASPQYEKLLNKAQIGENVRIIVGLKTSFSPEGYLVRSTDVSEQRIRISELQESILKLLKITDENRVKRYKYTPFIALKADKATLQYLINNPLVSSIEEDKLLRLQLWDSVHFIGASSGEANTYTGAGQTIAILDTGVDKTHPFLAGKVVEEACFSDVDSIAGVTSLCPNGQSQQVGSGAGVYCLLDGCKHGTHVAGIAAGQRVTATDGISILRGVAPDANIIAIQSFSMIIDAATCWPDFAPCIGSFSSDQKSALEYVYSLRDAYNITSVNISIGGDAYTANCDDVYPAIKADIDNLRSAGIATIVASGNDYYINAIAFPACISSAISVGATEHYGFDGFPEQLAFYSNSFSFLSLLAPGGCDFSLEGSTCGIYSSVPPEWGYWARLSGTSMAAPHVAGIWAMLKQKKPSSSVDEILAVLQSTGVPITDTRVGTSGLVTYITKPRIQADAALETLTVTPIALQSPSDNILFDTCSLYSLPTFSWLAAETFKSYEIQFSQDTGFSSIPVRVKSSAIETLIKSGTWKKVLLIPGQTGGQVYWRVVGNRADRTTFMSETRSIDIESPEVVGSPDISPTSKNSLPILSWENNCNIKFKVWFGNDPDFTRSGIKKKSISFSIKNPDDNSGSFVQQLTTNQWKAIRKLVGDVSGSTIYWYIESWDGVKRYSNTEVKNFLLLD